MGWVSPDDKARAPRPMVAIQETKADLVHRGLAFRLLSPRAAEKQQFLDGFIRSAQKQLCSVDVDEYGVFTFKDLRPADPGARSADDVVTDPIMLRCSCDAGKAAVSGDCLCKHVLAAQFLGVSSIVTKKGGKPPYKNVVKFAKAASETPPRSPFEDCELLHILGPAAAQLVLSKGFDATRPVLSPIKALSAARSRALPAEGTTVAKGPV